MNKHLKTFIGILVLGLVLIVGWKFTQPILQDRLQKGSSDASSTLATLRVGTDNWIGYFPLCSPGMKRNLRQAGYQLQCVDDQADYPSRFKKLGKGELQFAVATVDSYLLNGQRADYPATIIMVLDESKGGDAIVGRRSVFATMDDLKNKKGHKIAFTPSSPSEYLLKAMSNHFGLPFFTGKDSEKWAVKTSGSEEALQKLQHGDVDAAVLWEPDVSRALASPDFVKLIGTEDTARLIVDVLLVERRYSTDHPEAVQALVTAYFQTLHEYMQDPLSLQRDIKKKTDLNKSQINSMLEGVEWVTAGENNAVWFIGDRAGVKDVDGLVEVINYGLKILQSSGDLRSNPLPGGDPYRITNRHFVQALAGSSQSGTSQSADSLTRSFSPLTAGEWANLKKIGTLKVDPIPFRRSTSLFDQTGREIIDAAANKLRRYPNFRIMIEGHTGLSGDQQANLDLSAARAKAVAAYLIDTYNLDINRLRAVGYGSSHPLPQLPGESSRAYKYRLSRVDISLVAE
jgi:outer membrane protein OmpA-like peptidoglycan-associated protein/ABC-type nitrate/sulfonate/bicarbonate transport system substrate-binding protein